VNDRYRTAGRERLFGALVAVALVALVVRKRTL
jgi:hypothetical protein